MTSMLSSKAAPVWNKSLWIVVFTFSTCFFLFSLTDNDKLTYYLALQKKPGINYLTQDGQLFRYLSYSVLHAGVFHYFMNMLNMFFIYKLLLRYRTNSVLMTIVYIQSVVLGGLAQIHFATKPEAYLVGASAGIFGL
jgi:membrane associated rhomboid family serine protease